MKKKMLLWTVELCLLAFFSSAAHADKMPKDDFIKGCKEECATSPNRYASNMKDKTKYTDQCDLISFYADMVYGADENKGGAKLILDDICPKAFSKLK